MSSSLWAEPAVAQEFSGLGRVREDGTLVVGDRVVRLHGITIPLIDRTCRTFIRPSRCAPSGVLVLDLKVTGFVHCQAVQALSDGSIEAVCTVPGSRVASAERDLAAELVIEGWALTTENAPAQYRALERLAERRGAGLWNEGIVNVR